MRKVVVEAFGGVEQLKLVDMPDPVPGDDEVLVRLTSIGMNHADLMARRGEYRLASGDPPFSPGMEGGGYIEAVGSAVTGRRVGQRILLGLDAPIWPSGRVGTYGSHYLAKADRTIPAPDALGDLHLGAVWMAYLTAWGCLAWKQNLQPGQVVLLPAASSAVSLAAAQVVRHLGGISLGTTTSPAKLEKLQSEEGAYDHVVLATHRSWRKEVKKLVGEIDVAFDPVAGGEFLQTEIHLLAEGGTIWLYGLLGKPDHLDVTPLIRKRAALRGWLLDELRGIGPEGVQEAYQHVLDHLANGTYRLPVADTFGLDDVQEAHALMEQGRHVGKLVLVPV